MIKIKNCGLQFNPNDPLHQKPRALPVAQFNQYHKKFTVDTCQKSTIESMQLNKTLEKVLLECELNSQFKHNENRKKSINKLVQLGLSNSEAKATLNQIKQFIQNSDLTLNFDGSELNRIERIKKKGGIDKIWDAPKGIFSQKLLEKRNGIEKRMHGFSHLGKKDVANRPNYFAINLGNSPRGAAGQYGGSYFVLRSEAKSQATYSPCDSFNTQFAENRYEVFSRNHLEDVIASMPLSDVEKIYKMATGKLAPHPLPGNQYIEAHVLGTTIKDIEKIVLDRNEVPADSYIEGEWIKLSKTYGFHIEYYDSKGWEKEMVTGKFAEANSKFAPKEKGKEEIISNITQENVHHFMSVFGLEKSSKKLPFSFKSMKDDLQTFQFSLNNPNAWAIKPKNPFSSTLSKAQTFLYQNKSIIDFFQINKTVIDEYVKNLPSDSDCKKAKNDFLLFKVLHPCIHPSETQEKQNRLEKKYLQLKKRADFLEEQSTIKKELALFSFHEISTCMTSHPKGYLKQMRALRESVISNDTKQMVDSAKELYLNEKIFNKKLELFLKILTQPEIQNKIRKKKQLNEIMITVRKTKGANDALCSELKKFVNYIESDPNGWLQELSSL